MYYPKITFLVIAFTSVMSIGYAQDAVKPRPSPLAITAARYKDTYFKITYSQPHKKDREVFGNLVPFEKVWRTGANEATELTITQDILINNQVLKAGTYSLFTIPEPSQWTIIINSDLGMWGDYNYNEKKDVIRIKVPIQPFDGTIYEAFTISLDQKNDKAELLFLWDKTKVLLNIQFNEPKL